MIMWLMERGTEVDLKGGALGGQRGWDLEIEIEGTHHEGVGGWGGWIEMDREGERNAGGGIPKHVDMGQDVDIYTWKDVRKSWILDSVGRWEQECVS